MRAITVTQPGGPEVLRWTEFETPTPQAGEVLVRTVAAGVNRADLLQAAGNYPPPPGASDILGLEVSGRIAAVGDGVSEWTVGQEVCALLAGGGYAESVIVPAAQVMPIRGRVFPPTVTSSGVRVTCIVESPRSIVSVCGSGGVEAMRRPAPMT